MPIPVDECPAGWVMDAAVAVALGWHDITHWRNGEISGRHEQAEHQLLEIPRYSTDIGRLAEWATKDIFFSLAWVGGDEGKDWSCVFGAEENRAYAETAPLAICRAFLKTNGVESIEIVREDCESLDERLEEWCTRDDYDI